MFNILAPVHLIGYFEECRNQRVVVVGREDFFPKDVKGNPPVDNLAEIEVSVTLKDALPVLPRRVPHELVLFIFPSRV